MKQMKIWVLALIVLVGVGFTSCMNSDDNSTSSWMGPVEVSYSPYDRTTSFKFGELIISPTNTSLATVEKQYNFKPSTTRMAYIAFEYSTDEGSGNETATNKLQNVVMNYAVSLDETVERVTEKGASNDSIATAPIIRMTDVMASTQNENGFYILHDRYLFTGLAYFVQEKAHSFTLVNYPNEEVEEGTVKFYLRHSGTPEKETIGQTSVNAAGLYPYLYFKSFDIRNYLPTEPGKEVKIVVVVDQNTVNNKLDDETNTKTKEYTVTYKVEE